MSYLKILSTEEIDILLESIPLGLRMYIGHRDAPRYSDAWHQRIALTYVQSLVWQDYWPFSLFISDDISQSEVLKEYPELRDKLDDDGLLILDDSLILSDSGIEYKNHILYYHQFLRRGFKSALNFEFLNRFINYYHQSGSINKFRIAIDHHRMVRKDVFTFIGERDR